MQIVSFACKKDFKIYMFTICEDLEWSENGDFITYDVLHTQTLMFSVFILIKFTFSSRHVAQIIANAFFRAVRTPAVTRM